jgi:hypothetical protein
MSGEPPPTVEERHRASFVALVLLLRELVQGLLSDGRTAEARGLVDSIEALKAKTTGNLSEDESRFLDDVLFGLHMAVVRTPAKRDEPPPPGAEATPEGAEPT